MLSYIVIALAGILVAAVLVWVARTLADTGRETLHSVYGADRTHGTRFAHLNNNLEDTPAPWGWGGKKVPAGARFSDSGSVRRTLPHGRAHSSAYTGAAHDAQHTGAVRSVLTGYDMTRSGKAPDTSCWPYRENITTPSISFEDDTEKTPDAPEQPSKPWGW